MKDRLFITLLVVGVGTAQLGVTAVLVVTVGSGPRLDRIERSLETLEREVNSLRRAAGDVNLQDQTVQVVIDYLRSTGQDLDSHDPEAVRKARQRIQRKLDTLVREHENTWPAKRNKPN